MEDNNPIKNIIQEISSTAPKIDDKIYLITELTEEHKLKILKSWNDRPTNPPSLGELSKECFGVELDCRSRPVKLIKEFLASRQIKAKPTNTGEKVVSVPLTEEEKEFISNHCKIMNSTEIGRELTGNKNFQRLSIKGRQIEEYIESLPENLKNKDIEVLSGEYKPPKTPMQAGARVNRYILDCIKPSDIEKDTKLRNNLTSLVKYCHNGRFQMILNSYTKNIYKEIFEGAYVRYLWDKGEEVLEEELDLYINLCSNLVQLQKMDEEYNNLLSMQQISYDNIDEGKKISVSMSIVESLDSLRKQIKETEKQQRDLVSALQGRRSERVENKIKSNSSLVQLLDFWKSYDNRQLMIRLAEARRNNKKEEMKRIESISDLKLELYGVDPTEIL